MSRVTLIGAPTDIGASTRGAGMGPEALRVAGLVARLRALGITVTDAGNLAGPPNPWRRPVRGHRHLREVTEWCQATHDAVLAALRAGSLPLLMGGDHSLAIGSVSALARHCREQGLPYPALDDDGALAAEQGLTAAVWPQPGSAASPSPD